MTDPKPVFIEDVIAHKFKLDPDMRDLLAQYRALLADVGATLEYRTPLHADPFAEILKLDRGSYGSAGVDFGAPGGDRSVVSVHRTGGLAMIDGRAVAFPPVSVAIPRRNGRFAFEGNLMQFEVRDHSRARTFDRFRTQIGASLPIIDTPPPPSTARLWRHLDPAMLRPSSSAPIVRTDRLRPTAGQGWVRMSSTPRRPRR